MVTNLLILGGGNMGGALIRGWLKTQKKTKTLFNSIVLFDTNRDTREKWQKKTPTEPLLVVDDLHDLNTLETKPTTIVLAVKPDGVADAINSLLPYYERESDTCLISVAAGVPTKRLRAICATSKGRMVVLRAMPNLPVEVAQGVIALYGDDTVPAACYDRVARLFSALGTVTRLSEESLFDVITALCGSGPAYVYAFMEGLEEAAVRYGLSPADARSLTLAMVRGAAALVTEKACSPAQLRNHVTSPRGTTQAALEVLNRKKAPLPQLIDAALKAAIKRAQQLAS
ncbi:MAG: pyrroline-5-carboxylate reductase [Alphaproteobacteria bacterium GM202ARS2]|nr:pyrroline-5-carboxylate reductase [Alphaproteobacteria bacterium GM202ARS2]